MGIKNRLKLRLTQYEWNEKEKRYDYWGHGQSTIDLDSDAIDRITELEAALEKYAAHLPTCPALRERRLIDFPSEPWNKCTCGLRAALKGGK
jgi:hypothetical protein